ncbi:BQ5605_C030g10784 [Microbotryum silenes-dioicae]|uniref:BQ5605_C030g10784 protein n=1 Tax=Microbotryum silenes-dioicae TaxID=796604 RepID=A0A2X0PIW2_9BASI|nr:BQ5605_C030g10784 [Microbotryum silenes-dioicae]
MSSSSSSPPSPLLGTPYILAQSTPTSSQTHLTQITPSLCSNLSAFKALLRSSRALDDSIALRLNRVSALHRSFSNPDGDSCDSFWNELTTRWNERTRVLAFCDQVHLDQARTLPIPTADSTRIEKGLDHDRLTTQGRGETEVEVKRRQLRTETNVEAIIRARSLDLFLSRCPYHPQQPAPMPLPGYTTDNSLTPGDAVARRGRDGRGRVNWNG